MMAAMADQRSAVAAVLLIIGRIRLATLKYIRYFYEMYLTAENRQQAADDLEISENRQ